MLPNEFAAAMHSKLEAAAETAKTMEAASASVPPSLVDACKKLIREGTETTRLVCITNVSGTAVDPEVPVDILQAQAGGVDFRTLYKKSTKLVLAALAAEAEVKWSISADPYVSNPYREARIDDEWVERRGQRLPGAAILNEIIQAVRYQPDLADDVVIELMRNELIELQSRKIVYPIPPQLTVPVVSKVLSAWLDGGVGGNRLETVAVGLLRYVGTELSNRWIEVTSHHVNDPTPYDALCLNASGVHTVAEVKDQLISKSFFEQLSEQMIEHGASRGLLFTRQNWIPSGEDKQEIEQFLTDRALLGLRMEVVCIDTALSSWLPMLDADDSSLPRFLKTVTLELEEHGELADRTDLASILKSI